MILSREKNVILQNKIVKINTHIYTNIFIKKKIGGRGNHIQLCLWHQLNHKKFKNTTFVPHFCHNYDQNVNIWWKSNMTSSCKTDCSLFQMLLSICLDSAFPASTCVCIFIPTGTHATVHAQNVEMKRAKTQE